MFSFSFSDDDHDSDSSAQRKTEGSQNRSRKISSTSEESSTSTSNRSRRSLKFGSAQLTISDIKKSLIVQLSDDENEENPREEATHSSARVTTSKSVGDGKTHNAAQTKETMVRVFFSLILKKYSDVFFIF